MLYDYEQVIPGLASEIVEMAKREQIQRHRIEFLETEEPYKIAKRGQVFALVVVVLVLGFALTLALIGHPRIGGAIAALDLVGLVIAFLRGQQGSRAGQDVEERAPE